VVVANSLFPYSAAKPDAAVGNISPIGADVLKRDSEALDQPFVFDLPLADGSGPAASLAGAAVGSPSRAAAAGFTINLVWDASALAPGTPASFRAGVQNAAAMLQAAFTDPITVNIEVGYGEWANQIAVSPSEALGDVLNGVSEPYATLRGLLSSHATSADDQTAVNSLPNSPSLQGMSRFLIGGAQRKALGLLAGSSTAVDGAIGIGTAITGSNLLSVALHEITHAMGRVVGGNALDLFRYVSPGQHLFTSAIPAPAAYFSIDGGVTDLADFGRTSDPSDFLNRGVQDSGLGGHEDAFDEFYGASSLLTLSPVDLTVMDVLGFTRASPPVVSMALASDSGASASDAITSNPALAGSGDPNATVTIKEGATTLGTTTANDNGAWSFTPTLADGRHTLTASETSVVGTGSASLTFTLDRTPPVAATAALAVAANSAATPIGIAAPNDALADASALTITVTGLPSNGTVLLADGNTALAAGQTLTAAQLTGLEFRPTAGQPSGSSDFTYSVADPAGNSATGSATLAIAPAHYLLGGTTGWLLSGVGDFYGDNSDDVIWYDTATGQDVMTRIGNGQPVEQHVLGGTFDWRVSAIGDLDGDGVSDVIWRSQSSGQTVLAKIVGGYPVEQHPLGGTADWQLAAVGDFYGTGTDGVIWRSASSGQNVLARIENGYPAEQHVLGGTLDWQVAAVGDFYGTGSADVIWRSATSGQNVLARLQDGYPVEQHLIGGNLEWRIAAVGDFNNDGTDDIIWRSGSSGGAVKATIQGGLPADQTLAFGDLSETIGGSGHFTGPGAAALYWTGSGTGQTYAGSWDAFASLAQSHWLGL
jgi:hypothetical protein